MLVGRTANPWAVWENAAQLIDKISAGGGVIGLKKHTRSKGDAAFLNEHLPYEVQMMTFAHSKLGLPSRPAIGPTKKWRRQ
jgi:hypothetical protein